MKYTILFLTILTLFQSSYSYKNFNNETNQFTSNKKYKFYNENYAIKGSFKSENDSVYVIYKKGQLVSIDKVKVIKIKKRIFSPAKTILLPVTIFVTAVTVALSSSSSNGIVKLNDY